jgi:hypothetical protein
VADLAQSLDFSQVSVPQPPFSRLGRRERPGSTFTEVSRFREALTRQKNIVANVSTDYSLFCGGGEVIRWADRNAAHGTAKPAFTTPQESGDTGKTRHSSGRSIDCPLFQRPNLLVDHSSNAESTVENIEFSILEPRSQSKLRAEVNSQYLSDFPSDNFPRSDK